MVEPNIESEVAGQTSEIAKRGKWLRTLHPGPGVCIKNANKSLNMLHLGDWALKPTNFLGSYPCFQEPYSLYFQNGLDKTLIIFSFFSVSTVDFLIIF